MQMCQSLYYNTHPIEWLLLHLLLGNRSNEVQSWKRWGKPRASPPLFYRGTYAWHFCGNDAQQAGTGTCQIRGRENLLYGLTSELPDCQKHASICQAEFKAHSSHGNSELPFLLSSEEVTQQRAGYTKAFLCWRLLFLKQQTVLNVN